MRASRGQIAAQAKAVVGAMNRDEALPLWRADERTTDAEYDKLYESCFGPMEIAKALGGNSPYQGIYSGRDQFEARRSAVVAVCALRAYRRTHGQYPKELGALVPEFLPALPVDPFDGKTLRYKVVGDGSAARPVLYSIGVDQVDDGGVFPTADKEGRQANARLLGPFRNPKIATPEQAKEMERSRGDWVLYPPAPKPKPGEVKPMSNR